MSLLLIILVALLSIIAPGLFLALALLKKTKLNLFEITVIGFTFGLIFPPAMVWLESYLMDYIHAFTFSQGLYNVNVILLTLLGIALCFQQGVFTLDQIKPFLGIQDASKARVEVIEQGEDYKQRIASLRKRMEILNLDTSLIRKHEKEEAALKRRQAEELNLIKNVSAEERKRIEALHSEEDKRLMEAHEKEEMLLYGDAKQGKTKTNHNIVWYLLLFLMFLTFITRTLSISIAPKFFEFDPYFDMLSTEYILTHGYQLLYDHSAWPTILNGSFHRIEPIVPYLEAYWYQLANSQQYQYSATINTNLLSYVSSFYPPITAALLVFVVFMFLYHEYGEFPAIIGAAIAAAMPALLTTFIAGEQLLEPWGILTLFFFYTSYLLAVKDMGETRFAILAGLAFVSTFLGAHYYTVDAGVLAIYILLQGLILVLRKEDTRLFYRMNMIVIAIIAIFYAVFAPYGSVLTDRIPNLLHIPIIVGFPFYALLFVAVFEYVPKLLNRYKFVNQADMKIFYYVWLLAIIVVVLLLMVFTSLGNPVRAYITLSTRFTTPSIPLFMTVQEYAPTGFNFNFGPAGFGEIGASIFGANIIVWGVLIVFTAFMVLNIYYRNSKLSILSLAAVWPLALAGMTEIKYLPHFGVAYILAIGIIIGELLILIDNKFNYKSTKTSLPRFSFEGTSYKIIFVVSIMAILFESTVFVFAFSAAANQDCSAIANSGNGIGYTLYCQTISNAWLSATTWMRNNVGPYAPRILSWWDYGDWINWFGNSNAVLRGDNAVATLDYATAAQFVLSEKDYGYNASSLAGFMDSIQAKYLLFDNELMQKWGALDFLACIHANETSLSYAVQQGQQQGSPYLLGTSQCEINHDPVYALIPTSTSSINNYCQFNSSTLSAIKVLMIAGSVFLNQTYCVPTSVFSTAAPVYLYDQSGKPINAVIIPRSEFFYGMIPYGGQTLADFLVVYLPNAPNDTITNAPTEFYTSSYYKGFFFGKLDGFSLVYPKNFTGINYINSSNPIMILQLNNYTGGLPPVTPKPSWVQNNYTMPG